MTRAPVLKVIPILTAIISCSAVAGNFGTYDPRSQSMGGAAVAVGSVDMAAGHNPALLGLYNEDEDKSENGRYYLPYAVGNIASVAFDAIDLLDQELDITLDETFDRYNANPNAQNAAAASQAATDLEVGLQDIANRDITFSAFLPIISVAEPSRKGGGAFYVGTRIEGGGISFVPDDDLDLFQEYVLALDNIASGGDWRNQNCDVFNLQPDANGDIICSQYDSAPPSLRDPFDEIESFARISGLIINEAAVAMAWGFDFKTMRIAIGATPKVMQVQAFDELRDVSDDSVDTSVTFKPHLMFNTDIGLAVEFDMGLRLAYAGKDLITRNFAITQGQKPLKLNSKHRIGIGYIQPRWQLGIDYDLQADIPSATEQTGQFLSAGVEYSLLRRLALRAGYRHDTQSNLPGVTSLGIGARWARTHLNLSYQKSEQEKGAGLQLGFAF